MMLFNTCYFIVEPFMPLHTLTVEFLSLCGALNTKFLSNPYLQSKKKKKISHTVLSRHEW